MVAILCTGPKKLAGQTVTIYVIGDYKRYDKLMKKRLRRDRMDLWSINDKKYLGISQGIFYPYIFYMNETRL